MLDRICTHPTLSIGNLRQAGALEPSLSRGGRRLALQTRIKVIYCISLSSIYVTETLSDGWVQNASDGRY